MITSARGSKSRTTFLMSLEIADLESLKKLFHQKNHKKLVKMSSFGQNLSKIGFLVGNWAFWSVLTGSLIFRYENILSNAILHST